MTTSADAALVERFKPTIGRWWGVVGLVMLALLIVGIIMSGTDPASLAVGVGAAFIGWATYASLIRPTIHAYEDHLLLRNALTDLRLPWSEITDVDVKQTVCVYTGAQKHHGVAIGKSARYLIRGNKRGQSLMNSKAQEDFATEPTLEGSDVTGMHYADYVVLRIESLSREQTSVKVGSAAQREWAWTTVAVGVALAIVFAVLVVAANA